MTIIGHELQLATHENINAVSYYQFDILAIYGIYIYVYLYVYVHMVFECTEHGYSISSPATPSSWSPLSSWQKNRLISLYHAKHDRGVDDENLSKHGLKMKMRPTNGESSSPMFFIFRCPIQKKN